MISLQCIVLFSLIATPPIIQGEEVVDEVFLTASDLLNANEYTVSEDVAKQAQRDMLNPDLAEGDIFLPAGLTMAQFVAQWDEDTASHHHARGGRFPNVIIPNRDHGFWPRGRIPYAIAATFPNLNTARQSIATAMKMITDQTCITFVPRQPGEHYVLFAPDELGRCFSHVGKIIKPPNEGLNQPIHLSHSCARSPGSIAHEILHTLGFFHEQMRLDRDEYVRIIFNNIQPDRYSQFEKKSRSEISDLGFGYDYGSVMHYPNYAFPKNGDYSLITIEPLKPLGGKQMGQRDGPSQTDIRRVNKAYHCDISTTTSEPTTVPATVVPATTGSSGIPTACFDLYWDYYCNTHRNRCDLQDVKERCKKTCGVCGEVIIHRECVDRDDSCPYLANQGWCDVAISLIFGDQVGFTKDFCQASCKNCLLG